jgi:chromosome segregation ATPase
MKSIKYSILQFTGNLMGVPMIGAGKGLQSTGSALSAAGEKCSLAGAVTEAAGHATRADFADKAETAEVLSKFDSTAKAKHKAAQRLEKIQAKRERATAEAASLAEAEAKAKAEVEDLQKKVMDMPRHQPTPEEVPAEVGMEPGTVPATA